MMGWYHPVLLTNYIKASPYELIGSIRIYLVIGHKNAGRCIILFKKSAAAEEGSWGRLLVDEQQEDATLLGMKEDE